MGLVEVLGEDAEDRDNFKQSALTLNSYNHTYKTGSLFTS